MLERNNTEIFDQEHQMYAEGSSDLEPTEKEVIDHMTELGWWAKDVEVFFDHSQKICRWQCDIFKPLI